MQKRPTVRFRYVLGALVFAFFLLPLAVTAQEAKQQEAGSNVRPPVTKVDLQIVKRAREILDSTVKWNRADNRVCPPDAKTFGMY